MGFFDEKTQSYVDPTAKSEWDRTNKAIDYYKTNQMWDRLGAAEQWKSTLTPDGTPIRDWASGFGADLKYDEPTQNITLSKNGEALSPFKSGSLAGLTQWNGTNYITDQKAFESALQGLRAPAAQVPVQPPVEPAMDFDAIQDKMWAKIESMMPNMNSGSSTSTSESTYDPEAYAAALNDVKAASDPLHQVKVREMQQKANEAEMALRAQMSGSGAYDSSEMDKRLAALKGEYLNGVGDYEAEYESNMGNLANSMMQAGLNRKSQTDANYQSTVASLAQMYMNGTLDLTKFALDEAYRRAVLGQNATNQYMNTVGNW